MSLRTITIAITSFLVALTTHSNLLRSFFSFFLCTLFTVCPAGGMGLWSPVNAQETPGLEGTWIRNGTPFTGDRNGCRVGYPGQLNYNERNLNEGVEFSLTQQGNRLLFPNETVFYQSDRTEGSYILSTTGTRSQDTVRVTYAGGGFTTEFNGRISPDGTTVTGEATCQYGTGSARATGTFTWTRQATAQSPVSLPSAVSEPMSDRASFEAAFKQANVNEAVALFDAYQTQQYQRYLGLDTSTLPAEVTAVEISHRLYDLYQATGIKSGFLQAVSLSDRTDLILVQPTPRTQASKQVREQKSQVAVRKIVLEATQEELKKSTQQFWNQLVAPNRRSSRAYQQQSEKLYDWLVAPLELELANNGIQTLIVSADTGLRSLPVAALFDGQQYLIEKYSFALIPSFRLTNPQTGNLNPSNLLVMGISEATQGQTPLPAAGVEVEVLGKQLSQGKSFLNEQTTIAQLKQTLRQQQPEIIHLATHANFQPGNLNNSYIQFWNEKLSLSQLNELTQESEWEKVNMIVLSACRTALGDEQAELGFTGLAVQAGVETGIGTLWSVSDLASLGLMSEFYSRLDSAPNKAEALRQAQLAMINGDITLKDGQLQLSNNQRFSLPFELTQNGEPDLSHPYFWSGVTLIGSWN